MKQNTLTYLVPIESQHLGALRTYLEKIGKKIQRNPYIRFQDTPSTHFVRWVILDRPAGGHRLYFSACYDGEFMDYMAEITAKLGAGMEPIWRCCPGYPPNAASNADSFAEFLRPHSHKPGLSLIAFPGLSAREILANMNIRENVENSLDAIQHQVPPFSEAPVFPPEPEDPSQPIPPGPLAKLIDRLVGVQPGAVTPNARVSTNPALLEIEDVGVVQNQMTIISPVKKKWWPRLLLRTFLALARLFQRAPGPKGKLSGLSTIHFARWVLIDGGDNMLFESNYDGSWESYIDDFGDHAAPGMNAVWGPSDGFPRGGSLDIESFKRLIREHQHPAQVFYSAYPEATVANIAQDLAVRRAFDAARQSTPGAVDRFMSGSYR